MEISRTKIFTITALISAVIVFLVLGIFWKNYVSETDVLIVPQNEKTAIMYDKVLGNAAKIPLSVSFFDKLAAQNIEINNPVEGLSSGEKKDYWNSKLRTEIVKDSGIIKFIAKDADSLQAESISLESTKNTIFTLSGLYSIKEDVNIRIIDGPITQPTNFFSLIKIALSLLAGIILGALAIFFIPFIQNLGAPQDEFTYEKAIGETEKPKEISKEEGDILVFPLEKKSAPKEELAPKPIIEKQPTVEMPKSEPFVATEKKSFAPGNLPIADNSIVSMFGATKNGSGHKAPKETPTASVKEEKPAVYREATPEEVKERLNRLLRGI